MLAAVVRLAPDDPRELIEAILAEIQDAASLACHRYSVDPSEIEDLYHEIIVQLVEDDYRRLRSFRKESSIKTWLAAIALNYVRNYVSRKPTAISLDDLPHDSSVCAPKQEHRLLAKERRARLQRATKALSRRELLLLQLLKSEKLTHADVANEMQIKVDSVRRLKHALVKKLRDNARSL